MLRVGLTGGIGSGKSEVSRRLADHGAVLIDADVAAREVVVPGSPGLARIAEAFGDDVLRPDGSLNRVGLGEIVFADPGLGNYRKLVVAGGRLVGVVLYGDTTDALWYLELIRSGAAIEPLRQDLIFGRALAERRAA